MHPWISTLVVFCLMGTVSFATPTQAQKKTTHHSAKHPAGKHYECPKCHMMGPKAGKCPHCKVSLVPSAAEHAAYQCVKCKIKSAKAGKCPKCKTSMTKVAQASHKGHVHKPGDKH